MLKRDHQVVLPTQARAPGFRVELRGTTFRLVATGAWTVAEATQLDTALKRLRVPTRFIRFPEESHGLSRGGKPSRRVERLNYIIGWFKERM